MRSLLTTILLASLGAGPAMAIETEAITYDVAGTEHAGYIAVPDDIDGTVPGVIVVHEWWGLNDHAKRSAERLAEMGYVALALDMYGGGKSTGDPAQAGAWAGEVYTDIAEMKNRYQHALDRLKKHENVDASQLASIGFCFGGSVSLEMARAGLELDAVVSFHGGLKSSVPEDERNLSAAVLICHGASDPLVPQEDVTAVMAELDAAEVDWNVIQFGGQLHSFTNPDAPSGGDLPVRYDANSAERAFAAMETFFKTVFN